MVQLLADLGGLLKSTSRSLQGNVSQPFLLHERKHLIQIDVNDDLMLHVTQHANRNWEGVCMMQRQSSYRTEWASCGEVLCCRSTVTVLHPPALPKEAKRPGGWGQLANPGQS